jgi:hypothetical protein
MSRESRTSQFSGKPLATTGKTTSCFTMIISSGFSLFLLLIGADFFFVALKAPQQTDGIVAFYILGGVFCLLGVFVWFLRGGLRVHVYPDGLVIQDGKRTEVRWEDIESIQPQITERYRNNIFFGTKRRDSTRIQCHIRLTNGKKYTVSTFRGQPGVNDVSKLIKIAAEKLARVPSATVYPLKEEEVITTTYWIPRF